MATLPDVAVTGTVIEAAWGNDVRAAVTENPAYLAQARGDLFRASGAGAVERVALTAGGVLIGGADDPEWLAPGSDGEALLMSSGAPAWGSPPNTWEIIAEGNDVAGNISITSISGYRELRLFLNSKRTSGNQQPTLTWNSLSNYHYDGWNLASGSGAAIGGANAGNVPITAASVDAVAAHIVFIDGVGDNIFCLLQSYGDEDDGSETDQRLLHLGAMNGVGKITRIDLALSGRTTNYTLIGLVD